MPSKNGECQQKLVNANKKSDKPGKIVAFKLAFFGSNADEERQNSKVDHSSQPRVGAFFVCTHLFEHALNKNSGTLTEEEKEANDRTLAPRF
jgi:hypothetical protein